MKENIKIAKDLVKVARELVAGQNFEKMLALLMTRYTQEQIEREFPELAKYFDKIGDNDASSQYPVGTMYVGDDGARHWKTTFVKLVKADSKYLYFEQYEWQIHEMRSQYDECDTVMPTSKVLKKFAFEAKDVKFNRGEMTFPKLVRGVGKNFHVWNGQPVQKGYYYYY